MLCTVTRETSFKPNHKETWDAEFLSFGELRRFGRKQSQKFNGCDIIITDSNGKQYRFNRLMKN